VTRALVRDVARVVDARQTLGWVIDDDEVDAVLPDALRSVCRTGEAARAAGLAWLDAEIARRGGPPAEAWLRTGKDLDKIDELLLFARTRLVLERADASARAGKCPFWMEKDPHFDGIQVVARRWIVGAEAGGRFILGWENGVAGFGGGGAARVLGGYGLTERASLYLGLEAGGGARFTKVPIGERATIPDFVAIVAVPVVGRYAVRVSGFVEAELGFMAYLNQVEARVEPGFRAGVAVGGLYSRLKRGLLPRFAFAVSVDHAPGLNSGYTLTQLSAGFRGGFDLSR
jgi:hypothetical protein